MKATGILLHRFLFLFVMVLILSAGCQYRKGDAYTSSVTGDTLKFLVKSSGSGARMLKKVRGMVYTHVSRGDRCQVYYLSDTLQILHHKSVLLFHTSLPNADRDMLNKGYLGTISSKQMIQYIVVTQEDFNKVMHAVNK